MGSPFYKSASGGTLNTLPTLTLHGLYLVEYGTKLAGVPRLASIQGIECLSL